MMRKLLPTVLLQMIFLCLIGQDVHPIRIGIFTDCQYCNCEPGGKRFYNLSLQKLDSCIGVFNSLPLDAVFHLGDMIDHDFRSYDSVLPRFRKFSAPLYLVLGNHDYMIRPEYKDSLLEYIGMKEGYYRRDFGLWTLVVLNGDDLSYFAPQSRDQRNERNEMVGNLYGGLRFNGMPWNGGIGKAQLMWLEGQLEAAQAARRKVIVLCHFSLFSRTDHNLFNRDELFAQMARYPCVKAYFNGHYHSGNYTEKEGIHIVNFMGMVNTTVNAFSVVTLTADSILIDGYGREHDRNLKIR